MTAPENLEPIEVTVTFLEMTAPPTTVVHPPSNLNIALLAARRMPVHYYRYLMDRVGRRWHWVNALRMEDEDVARRLGSSETELSVLYLEGAPAGFFEIRKELPSACELAFFGLMEHALGIGLGRWFLASAVRSAWSHRPELLRVQTCTLDHPAALRLYQLQGFTPVGQSKEYVTPLSLSERATILARS